MSQAGNIACASFADTVRKAHQKDEPRNFSGNDWLEDSPTKLKAFYSSSAGSSPLSLFPDHLAHQSFPYTRSLILDKDAGTQSNASLADAPPSRESLSAHVVGRVLQDARQERLGLSSHPQHRIPRPTLKESNLVPKPAELDYLPREADPDDRGRGSNLVNNSNGSALNSESESSTANLQNFAIIELSLKSLACGLDYLKKKCDSIAQAQEVCQVTLNSLTGVIEKLDTFHQKQVSRDEDSTSLQLIRMLLRDRDELHKKIASFEQKMGVTNANRQMLRHRFAKGMTCDGPSLSSSEGPEQLLLGSSRRSTSLRSVTYSNGLDFPSLKRSSSPSSKTASSPFQSEAPSENRRKRPPLGKTSSVVVACNAATSWKSTTAEAAENSARHFNTVKQHGLEFIADEQPQSSAPSIRPISISPERLESYPHMNEFKGGSQKLHNEISMRLAQPSVDNPEAQQQSSKRPPNSETTHAPSEGGNKPPKMDFVHPLSFFTILEKTRHKSDSGGSSVMRST